MLEGDPEAMSPRHWVGLYCNEGKDPVFVAKCVADFTPNGKQ